jgi:hypothetical protein
VVSLLPSLQSSRTRSKTCASSCALAAISQYERGSSSVCSAT